MNQVQKLLDYGVPVTMNGIEYFQAHKLFQRAEVRNDGVVTGHRALEARNGRLAMMNMVSTMSEEEFMIVSSTLALNEQLKNAKPVIEMIHDALEMFKKFSNQRVTISKYLNDEGDEVALSRPMEGFITRENGDFPFQICLDDIHTKGAKMTGFNTIWKFTPNELEKDGPWDISEQVEVYGSSHSMYEERGVAPKIKIHTIPEAGMSPK
jgi:hypothetical protein